MMKKASPELIFGGGFFDYKLLQIRLFEIINACLEELLLLAAGDVDGDAVIDDTFGMAHLAEHAAVRAGDAFDGAGGTVGIPWHVGGGFAVEIAILEGNLTVGDERCNLFICRDKAAFTMGDWNGVDVARLDVHEPRREIGGDDRIDGCRGMSADRVERQRRIVVGKPRLDLAVGDEAEFDKSLEAVADTDGEAVAFIEKLLDSFRNARVAERGGDELSGAVRLVTRGEAAREGDDLRIVNSCQYVFYGIFNGLRVEVADDHWRDDGARAFEGALRVIFAVRSGEDRNENARFCDGRERGLAFAALRVWFPDRFRGGGRLRDGRESRFERFLPGGDGVVKFDDILCVDFDDRFVDCLAERNGSRQFALPVGSDFENDGAVRRDEEVIVVGRLPDSVEFEADEISEGHLGNGGGDAATTDGLCGND